MRQRYLDAFDIVRIDSLNGDKYRTGKLTPDGDMPDPSVFSTPDDPVGIQVGTAIATLVRKDSHQSAEQVAWRELWGVGKLQELEESSESEPSALYQLNRARCPVWACPSRRSRSAKTGRIGRNWSTCSPLISPASRRASDTFLVDIDGGPSAGSDR